MADITQGGGAAGILKMIFESQQPEPPQRKIRNQKGNIKTDANIC